MFKQTDNILIPFIMCLICIVLIIGELPISVSSDVVDRLLWVVVFLFVLLYLGLFYSAEWVFNLMPLLRICVWSALCPLLTYWGTIDQFPYGDVVTLYATTFFQVSIGILSFVVGYALLLHHNFKKT